MHGDSEILDLLNSVLTGELTAINQYFLHARMQRNWGYERLAEKSEHESIEEMKHAQDLADRILFLEGMPNFQRLGALGIGETVPEQLRSDLNLERNAVEVLRPGITTCRGKGDVVSALLLERILDDEEEHIDWLETQLSLIDSLGEQHYLTQQVHGDS